MLFFEHSFLHHTTPCANELHSINSIQSTHPINELDQTICMNYIDQHKWTTSISTNELNQHVRTAFNQLNESAVQINEVHELVDKAKTPSDISRYKDEKEQGDEAVHRKKSGVETGQIAGMNERMLISEQQRHDDDS